MEDLPGIQPTFTQPIEMRISEMLTGRAGIWRSSCSGLTSPNWRAAGQIQQRLQTIPGTSEAVTVANDKVDYLQFDIDRAAAGRVGMPSTTCRTRCARRWKACARAWWPRRAARRSR
jgi:cobalt-zinc-cadmium resistance protein CzcA